MTIIDSHAKRDHEFESAFLQQAVCLSGEPRGCTEEGPHFGDILRVAGDVRRDVQGCEPGLLRPFSLTGIDAVPPPASSDPVAKRHAAAVGPRPGAHLSGVAV